jgi:hypothetical protein
MEDEIIMVPFEQHTLVVPQQDTLVVVPIVEPVNVPVEIEINHRGPSWF